MRPYCYTIGCDNEPMFEVLVDRYQATHLCRACAIADGWSAEALYLIGHEQTLAEMGLCIAEEEGIVNPADDRAIP